jgi:hypothetical protein
MANINMNTSLHQLPPNLQHAYARGYSGQELPGELDQAFQHEYTSMKTRFTASESRENQFAQAADYFMMNMYEHVPVTCQTASVQGARTNLDYTRTSGFAQCPPAVSVAGFEQSPSAQDLIEASTEARQGRARLADRDPFIDVTPNDGTFGTRLMGSAEGDAYMTGCDARIGSGAFGTSACALGPNKHNQLTLPAVPSVSFYGDLGVVPTDRAVLGRGLAGSKHQGCSLNNTSGGNSSLCSL